MSNLNNWMDFVAAEFVTEDFLLQNEPARILYHRHAAEMPIYDYHCHLPPAQIAEDKRFENLTQVWLYGDHYKWRAMRTNGISERYCTGDTSDWEKFEKWAQTVPYTLRNPLYHWTHLELKRYFGICGKLLGPDTAKEIYDACGEMLRTPEYSVRSLLRKMNVKIVCTTDDPIDSLEHHIKIKKDGFEVKVMPTWRPDKGMAVENVAGFNQWVNSLAKAADVDIRDFKTYLDAIRKRHDFFHAFGCRISDHGIDTAYAADYTESQIKAIFNDLRNGKVVDADEVLKFKSAMMYEFALMD
jgi:glucuronate isomerase